MGCGDIKFLQGGVIDGSSILNSQIMNSSLATCRMDASTISKCDIDTSQLKNCNVAESYIGSSEIENCEINKLAGIDAPSAKTIADAIAVLPKDELMKLASALFEALQVPVAQEPELANDGTISTNVFGDADGVLGKPAQWGAFGGFVVPMYKPGE